jgi:peptidoglycan/LPS O-acetylase OafA/YrhL
MRVGIEPNRRAETVTNGHFTELDGMRGVLSVAVMLFHFGLTPAIARASFGLLPHSNWGLCVDFFFLLSGFVLCHSYLNRPVTLVQFLRRRASRLLPMYVLATVFAFGVTPGVFGGYLIAANLLMVQPLFALESIDFPAWSLPYELYLPLVVVAAAAVIAKIRRATLTCSLFLVIFAGSATCYLFEAGDDHQFVRAALGLAGGALLYKQWTAVGHQQPSAAIAVIGVLIAIGVMASSGVLPSLAILFYPAAIAAIWFGANATGLFSIRPLQAIGRWSYSIYLLHAPVLSGIQMLAGRDLHGIVEKILLVTLVLALSGICYRWIEVPAMRLRSAKRLALRHAQ